jgi:fibro-slime domain-containing protein
MKAIIAFFLTFVLGSIAQSQPSLILTGTAYDFSNSNSGGPKANNDFNNYLCGLQRGMVEDQLGDNGKPVLKDRKNCVDSAESFSKWFRPVDGVNIPFDVTLTFYWDDASKSYKYRNNQFFPLDNMGYGGEGYYHNYGFCFELHTWFTNQPGQVFDFMGDDDVWVFINNKLAIDLGGVHSSSSDSVNLDYLGLTVGDTYPLDFFFCERHYSESNLVISTSIKLDPCGTTDSDGDGVADLCDECPKGDMGFKVWADDQIGPNNGVTFHVALTNPTSGITIRGNFGDEATETDGDPSGITGWKYFNDVTGQLDVTHNYEKPGEYNVYFEGSRQPGCGNQAYGDLVITVGGKRLAPKCAEYSVVPGAPSKRKRSL